MKNRHLTMAGVLGLLAGFAAVYFVWSRKPASTPAESTGARPAESTALPVAPSAQKPAPQVASHAPSAASDLANARGKRYEGGIPKLETGYDLSKVKLPGAETPPEEGAAEPAGPLPTEATGEESWTGLLDPSAKADRNQGRIAMDEGEQDHDFGKIRQGELGSFDFQLLSDGKEPLVISGVKPSCGCTKADLALVGADGTRTPYTKGEPIPVGAKFVLETEINTDARPAGPFSAQVSLFGNDARGPFNLRLAANIEPVLTVSPSTTVFLGRLTTANTAEQLLTITSTAGQPFLLTPGKEAAVEPLSVDYSAKDPDPEGRSSEWEIKIKLGPNIPIGMRTYPVRFTSDIPIPHPKYPSQDGSVQNYGVTLNVQAQVTGMVSAEPSFVTFGMVKPGEPVERSVRIECHDDFKLGAEIPVHIEGLQGQPLPFGDALTASVQPLEDGHAADLKVRLAGLPGDLNGSFGGLLKIKVGHPFMEELTVRFSGVCRPALPSTGGK